MIGNNHNS